MGATGASGGPGPGTYGPGGGAKDGYGTPRDGARGADGAGSAVAGRDADGLRDAYGGHRGAWFVPALPAAAAVTGGEGPGRGGPGDPGRTGRSGSGGGSGTRVGAAVRLPGPLLRHRAQLSPHAVPALPYPGEAAAGTGGCSFFDLDRRARAVAAALGTRLQPGSRVLLAYPQGPDLAGAFFGTLYAGMSAILLVTGGPGGHGGRDGLGAPEDLARAVRRSAPDLVLTGTDGRSALPVDRARTAVVEADGIRVAGDPVWRLAENWRPVGVLRTAPAYHRYRDDGGAGGRLEAPMAHADLADVMDELVQALRLGTDEENVGWIAAVNGVEDAVWRILLPVAAT